MRRQLLTVLGVVAAVGLIMYLLGFRMTQDDLFISAKPEPLFCITGTLVGETCEGGVPFTNSILLTIIVDLTLVLAIVFGARNMKLIPTGFQNLLEVVIEVFYNFALGVDRKNIGKFFALPATIFLFFLIGNFLTLVPGVGSIGNCLHVGEEHALATTSTGGLDTLVRAQEEPGPTSVTRGWPGDCPKSAGNVLIPWLRAPAADLNVTLAFSLVAVFMVEFYGFQALGLGYLGKFFNFREGILPAIVGIMELISEFMRLIAFAFRIFGNIFGGEVVLVVMAYLFPFLLPLPFYGLEVFVAIIQAVIFSVLTLIFMSLAVQAHGHDEHGNPEPLEEADSMARALPH